MTGSPNTSLDSLKGTASSRAAAPTVQTAPRRRRTPLSDAWDRIRRDRGALAGLALILIMVFLAVGAPVFAPHDPLEQTLLKRLQPPSAEYPFG